MGGKWKQTLQPFNIDEFGFIAAVQINNRNNDNDENSHPPSLNGNSNKSNEKVKSCTSKMARDALDDASEHVSKSDDDEYIIGFLFCEIKTKSNIGMSGYMH